MSIAAFIKTHEGTSTLRRVDPPQGEAATRAVWLAPLAQRALDDPNSAINLLSDKASVQALLETWIVGRRMFVRLQGKRPGASLALLDAPPPDVWEFRVTQPLVQIRAFGRFVAANAFVVTHMHTRGMLGAAGSSTWRQATRDCVAEWSKLFPNINPFQGNIVRDYVTANAVEIR